MFFPSPQKTSYLTWSSLVISKVSKTGLIQFCLAKDKRFNSVGRYFYSSTMSSWLLPYQNIPPISLFSYWNSCVNESSFILPFLPYWITKDCGHALVIQSQSYFYVIMWNSMVKWHIFLVWNTVVLMLICLYK